MSRIGNYVIEMQEAHETHKCIPECYFCYQENERIKRTPNCIYCKLNFGIFGPNHYALPTCKSGGHNHCTCDICF